MVERDWRFSNSTSADSDGSGASSFSETLMGHMWIPNETSFVLGMITATTKLELENLPEIWLELCPPN